MKNLRIAFLSIALLTFIGAGASTFDSLQKGNTEQAANSVAVAFLALAAPAVAKSELSNVLGFMAGGITRGEQHLLDWLKESGRVDLNTYNDYMTGKLRLINAEFYVRKIITSLSGIQPIWDERTNKATGISNLHQARLDKGVNAVITNILVGYVTHATEVDPKALNGYDSTISNFPAGLRNGHVIVKQDGTILQDPIPVSRCGSQADSTASQGKVDSFELKTPIILEEQKQIVVELDLPVASFASNQHHVELFLLGSKTRVRSNS